MDFDDNTLESEDLDQTARARPKVIWSPDVVGLSGVVII